MVSHFLTTPLLGLAELLPTLRCFLQPPEVLLGIGGDFQNPNSNPSRNLQESLPDSDPLIPGYATGSGSATAANPLLD